MNGPPSWKVPRGDLRGHDQSFGLAGLCNVIRFFGGEPDYCRDAPGKSGTIRHFVTKPGIGYSLGIGLAACFFETTKHVVHLAGLYIPWHVLFGAAGAVLVIVVMSSLLSIRRVLVLEPAVVFR